MNTESLYDKFLKGKLAVLVDKDNPEEIRSFYELLKDENFLTPGAWNCSVLNYLLNKASGPYHFIDVYQHKINGTSFGYIVGFGMEHCTLDKFLLENIFEDDSSDAKTDLNAARSQRA